MKGTKTPFGEARRLRYFVIMCTELLKSQSMDVDLFLDKVIITARRLNPKLKEYVRSTGIMQSRPVAGNYLRFAGWLNFLRIEGFLIIPNGRTVFLANLETRENFFLTNEEKIGFFLSLVEIDNVIRVLSRLEMKNSIRDFIKGLKLSEHFVQSFFEWFVDLGILAPTGQSFGIFNLTNTGYHVVETAKQETKKDNKEMSDVEIFRTYFSFLLGSAVGVDFRVDDINIWKTFQDSLEKLGKHVRSEVDPNLYSALPIVLDLQVQLIIRYHMYVSLKELIKRLKDISPIHNTVFNWDPLANAGYVKL